MEEKNTEKSVSGGEAINETKSGGNRGVKS